MVQKKQHEKPKKKYEYHRKSFVIGKKEDGTPDRVWVRGKTPEEAEEKLRDAKRRHGLGLNLGEMTVREWSVLWMDVYKAGVSDNQHRHYQAKLKHDILPAIGNLPIKSVRASHLIRLLNNYEGGKKDTVTKIRSAIQQLFEDAAYEGVIERDPASRLELPDVDEAPRRPLTCIEREIVLSVAKEHVRGPYVLTLYGCGIRRGECVALTMADINFKKKQISINKSVIFESNAGILSTTKSEKLRKGRRKVRTKTDNDDGTRIVPIPDMLIPVLETLCKGKKPNDFLFHKADGNIVSKSALSCWWSSFKRACHIKAGAKMYRNAILGETSVFGDHVTPHYLRHTYATDLYAVGIDKDTRSALLGHTRKDVTDHYTKMTDEVLSRTVSQLNQYYASRSWCSTECIDALPNWYDDPETRTEYGEIFGTYLAHVFDSA